MLTLTYQPAWENDQSQDDDHDIPLDRNYYEFHEVWDDIFGDHHRQYDTYGERLSQNINLSPIVNYVDSEITWESDEPDDTSVTVEARVNGGDWRQIRNGGKIPLQSGTETNGMRVCTRQMLRTSNNRVTPELTRFEINIYGEHEVLRMNGDKVGMIRHREIEMDDTGKASEVWTTQGPDLKGIAEQRITVPPEGRAEDRLQAPAETIMKQWVENNLVNPTDSDRAIPNMRIAPDQERGETINRGTRYKNLAEELESISQFTGLGWNIYADFEENELVFDVYEGVDRTAGQDENPRVIFSPEFDTLGELHFVDSQTDYKNTAYVAGQGEGEERLVTITGEGTGLDRHEIFIDARDVGDEDDDGNEIDEDEQIDILQERGQEELSETEVEQMLEGGILTHSTFQYERDYRLGDKVTLQKEGWHFIPTVTGRPLYNGETFATAHDDLWLAESDFIGDLQELLVKADRDIGDHGIDRVFGQNTLDAVRDFQERYGISYHGDYEYGVPTDETIAALEAVVNGDEANIPKPGLAIDTPITEIKEVFEPGTTELEAVFGKEMPNLISKVKREISQIGNEIRR
ncbi:hypothetical protein HUG15_05795 [Salicibibacter cibarius]|uniref:Peptidoglycan-binding protein n=1 Tax=Salicibibacter cibarius TaxID=2743000 RepID=A0A7T7CAP2_9BACI|nr:peptidoglycan-binding protein [Salicibibacter cibarius]QQK75107.1 hypothetical protein HUG15_05465 [Salicibibacter cibarius]QQK75167.1 hypothetical protein HUG15_05795 [Salicibibacter cibarius]